MRKRLLFSTLLVLLMVGLLGCGPTEEEEAAALAPLEEEQIENVVKEYIVRDSTLPDYDVTIEAATDSWARVSINPVAAEEGQEAILYLQKQAETDSEAEAPTVAPEEAAGNEGRVQSNTGWTIVLEPQPQFDAATLDDLGVPAEVRP